ncbi:xanthine dehydrogenase subunit D [Mesobacillus foraminis]|uniref:xanthine dehydrogenase subunit D n=1 Tax=Mesobacillus foraminis TaxID=279826 RepID=UPI0039A10E49
MMEHEENARKQSRVRPDGAGKVSGSLQYLTDLYFPDMLFGKILRSSFPHARILSICTEKARQLPGVKAVITHKDVPGLNGFGLIVPDQPVLCKEIARYVGDAIAAVAADTIGAAEKALKLIEVEYEPLPVIDTPEKAMEPDAPQLHDNGNVMHRAGHKKGDVRKGFEQCSFIVEETYRVPRQMHVYMETEGGVIVPEKNGTLTVYVGTQHGYKDRFQLARILGMPEEQIRIISSPIGGSFGGKDELNIQPYGAMLALITGCPVKIHQTRKESVISGLKRHPMKIIMKTGASKEGKLLAHKVEILADTGAYATLGPAILDFAVEHSAGPYMVPNIHVEGVSVFTNNGVAGEFRGFGGNQITFALESQIDRLAEKLGMDSLEFRRRNIRKAADAGPLGQRIAETNGASEVLEGISPAFEKRRAESEKWNLEHKWKRRGVGAAIAMHGGGLGYGRLDPAGGRLSLTNAGKIQAAFSFEECGQGILAVIETIMVEELSCGVEDLEIVIGDTAAVPHSGSTTASRGTSMVWLAVQRMKKDFADGLLTGASRMTNVPEANLRLGNGGIFRREGTHPIVTYRELAQFLSSDAPLIVSSRFDFPTTPDKIDSGHFLYSFSGVLVQVEVDILTGQIKMVHLDQVISAGPVVNPAGYTGQIEGGGVMGIGYALMEEAVMVEGRYAAENLDSYLVPSICDVPELKVMPVETLAEGDHYGPRGVGEIGTVAVAPAITKAIHDALGHWVQTLPVSAEEIITACGERGMNKWMKTT